MGQLLTWRTLCYQPHGDKQQSGEILRWCRPYLITSLDDFSIRNISARLFYYVTLPKSMWPSTNAIKENLRFQPGGRSYTFHKPNVLAAAAVTSAPTSFKNLSIKLVFLMPHKAHRWRWMSPKRACPSTFSLSFYPFPSQPFLCCS